MIQKDKKQNIFIYLFILSIFIDIKLYIMIIINSC